MNAPIPLSKDELVDVLTDILDRVKAGDSFEGSLEYMMPGPDDDPPYPTYAMVRAAYRVGNLQGQGGMRHVGRYDEQVAMREFERQGEVEDAADRRVTIAKLRQVLAANGLEDPAWRNLSPREKAVLVAADVEVLAKAGAV